MISGGEPVDRLLIVSFTDTSQLVKQGDNLYISEAPTISVDSEVVQGALEEANLNAVTEMVDLISAFRAYEASQKVIKTHDETLDRAVNDIARL